MRRLYGRHKKTSSPCNDFREDAAVASRSFSVEGPRQASSPASCGRTVHKARTRSPATRPRAAKCSSSATTAADERTPPAESPNGDAAPVQSANDLEA